MVRDKNELPKLIKYKCCNCGKPFEDLDEANLHRKWAFVDGLFHTVVPIEKCNFCKGCN